MAVRPELHVVAGVLEDCQGRLLIAQRPVGKHLAGRWEFPGGKLARGESPLAGLKRELTEELGVTLEGAEPLIRLRHDYPDRHVLLDVWRVTGYRGVPRGLDGQALDWVAADDLPAIDLLEADRPIITALRLPRLARCLAGIDELFAARSLQPAQVLFWSPRLDGEPDDRAMDAVGAARGAGHRVIVLGDSMQAATIAAVTGADGLLIDSGGSQSTLDPSGAFLVGVICPDPAAAAAAVAAGAHFLVLAPHSPDAGAAPAVDAFARIGVPAYLGWCTEDAALGLACACGAHGCAIGTAAEAGRRRTG